MAEDGRGAARIASAVASNAAASAQQLLPFRLSFTHGFLAGQLSVIIIALIVIRFVIFEDSGKSKGRPQGVGTAKTNAPLPIRKTRSRRERLGSVQASLGSGSGDASQTRARGARLGRADVGAVMSDIMKKVHYEVESHGSESIDWLGIIVAQALAGYRQDISAGGWSADQDGGTHQSRGTHSAPDPHKDIAEDAEQRTARDWMEEILNAKTIGRGLSFLDPIQVINVDFGDSYPVFSNAKVRPADDMGRMRIEVDVDYSDCVSLAIETKLLINLPRPRFAVLPISLGLTIERFSGTLAIELFSSTPSTVLPQSRLDPPPRSRHELHFSLHPDFTLDASATSLVGSRAKLQDVPKIEQILVGRVRNYIHDRFVWPKYWSLTLPNLVPRDVSDVPTSTEAPSQHAALQPNGTAHDREGMLVVGQGDHEAEQTRESRGHYTKNGKINQSNPFFETAPPLFSNALYGEEGSRSSINGDPANGSTPALSSALPGSLPAVEAWRSQAAASSSAARDAHAGSLRSRMRQAQTRTYSSGTPAAGAKQDPSHAHDLNYARQQNAFGAPVSGML